jgi:uncharacterized protein YbaA (DUF1428 family)
MIEEFKTAIPQQPADRTAARKYVDGYVLPIPKNKIAEYRRLAQTASEVWREHGALEYRESVGEDLDVEGQVPFPQLVHGAPDETVVFAWIVFKSRAHRDEVNAKVMKDPRLAGMDSDAMPFDCKRMAYGGFEILVDSTGTQTGKSTVSSQPKVLRQR